MLLIGVTGLAACSKLNSPQPGTYRAAIQMGGGEIPMQLRVDRDKDSALQLWVVEGDLRAQATDVVVNGNRLQATLPHQLGSLQVQVDRNRWQGQLQLAATKEQAQPFAITAKREASYRFWKDSLTDNADISGNWRVQLGNVSALMSLTQSRDIVDGQLQLHDMTCDVMGQVHNDDLSLAAFCKGQLWLLRGGVNKAGALAGEAWRNHDSSQAWQATHTDETIQSSDDPSRQVSLPWAVPTR